MAIVFFHLFRAGRSTKPRVEMDPKSSTHGFGETGVPGQVSSPRNLAIYAVPMGTKKGLLRAATETTYERATG